MDTFELAYGNGTVSVSLDSPQFAIDVLNPHNPPKLAEAYQAFQEAASHPIGSKAIKDLVAASDAEKPSVCIVIADHTRPVPDHLLVPWIVEELGVSDEQVTILIGTGTHRASTDLEIDLKLGADVAQRYRIVNHDCENSDLVDLGKTSCGGPCLLNKIYVDADIKIVTGFIEPHFFAGFSGGSKGVMPGVAGLDTVRHFHRASLIANPNVTWGDLENNPLQAVCREMVQMCPPDVMVNVTLNLDQEITNVFVGDVIEAHRAGCAVSLEEAMVNVDKQYPIVITSNSGYPLDQNFYQSVKGMSAADRICADGGHIIVACECSAGLPHDGEFADLLGSDLDNAALLQEIMDTPKTRHDQWQVQTLLQIDQRASIHFHSALSEADQALTRTQSCSDIAARINEIAASMPAGETIAIAVLPRGPLTIPTFNG